MRYHITSRGATNGTRRVVVVVVSLCTPLYNPPSLFAEKFPVGSLLHALMEVNASFFTPP